MLLSDRGHTLLHISYSQDIESLYDGSRSVRREQIIKDNGVNDNDGVFSIESDEKDLAGDLFKFSQCLTQIYDLAYVSQERTEQTFYFELERILQSCINGSELQQNYIPSEDPKNLYSVDYHVKSRRNKSVYVYGIHNSDKARLVTINLQHFQIEGLDFDSLIVFENQQQVSRKDVARVSDVASNQVYSIERTPIIQETLTGMLNS